MADAESSRDAPPDSRCIAVRIRDGLYGLSVEEVQEVIALRPLTRVFHAPEAIAGVTSLRGEVLPVVDVGVLLGGSAASSPGPLARIVVVREPKGRKRRAGFLIDELGGLREVPASGLGELPQTVAEAIRELCLGVIPQAPPCSVLGVTRVLDAPVLADFAGEPAESP